MGKKVMVGEQRELMGRSAWGCGRKSGRKLIGKWDPKAAGGGDLERMGWLMARDLEEEAWVRVKGLPLSLWTPSILRRVGDECGGFVAMDGPTERMEDLRWARLLVKTKRGMWPSSIEIEVEKTTFLLPMWWEAMSLIRKKSEVCRSAEGCEEGDDGDTRAGRRVEEWSSAGIKAQLRSDDVMDGLPDGKERAKRQRESPRGELWATSWAFYGSKSVQWAVFERATGEGAQRGGPPQRSGPKESNSGPLGVSAQSGLLVDANIELEFLRVREMETEIVQKANSLEELVDSALHKEVMRYEALSSLGGLRVSGNSSSSLMITLGRTPEGEFFDHSGEVREFCQIDKASQGQEAEGTRAYGSACWELVEFKGSLATAREQEGGSSQNEIQDERGEEDLDWQESSLARDGQIFRVEGPECVWLGWGILICWDKRVLELLEWEGVVVGRSRGNQKNLGGAWCLGGDFNITLAQGERNRQGRITSAIRRFAEVVDDLGLVDLHLQGGAFTWTGGLNNMSRARLDRFLVSPCWLDQFSRGIEVRGSAGFRLSAKLKELKQKLKVWNREEFGNLESNKEAAIQQVEYWDRVEDERSLSMEELACKKEAKEVYAKWVELEETHWRQASRELWLKAGPDGPDGNEWGLKPQAHQPFGGLYKLLAKVLANRLKKVIDKVVSHDQNAFVKGRQILDASLIANEVIDNWNKKGDKGVICKLDIEKAYDSINWQFLLKVMDKMGFGAKWLRWMWWCISTAKFSVIVNGTPAGFFSSSKGLHQGDPLSPYLFVMGMEVLSVLIRRAMEGGFISGCKIQRNRAASGLKINLAKSEVILVGEVQRIEEMVVELGCRVGKLPSVYLGLPPGVPNKAAYG
ncbi:LINE-1 retrotransposable element ORF2 protein [Vitis vinifera]|uniref:LINE-1 retrotransposable element ORF2 protein n=1 Tax=Vitis vinifera TaxID=29760 RepID=A0A438GPJ0_VITVI|nr:LINE-1 retrotransposable element ORF2 protein [Vitis vinifera]